MSNFVQSLGDDELRVRNGQAFTLGGFVTGTVVNWGNVIFGFPTGTQLIVVTRFVVSVSVGQNLFLSSLAVDPGLANQNAPSNRNLNSATASAAKHEFAVAAPPASTGTLAVVLLGATGSAELISNSKLVLGGSRGLLITMPPLAVTLAYQINWYELPA